MIIWSTRWSPLLTCNLIFQKTSLFLWPFYSDCTLSAVHVRVSYWGGFGVCTSVCMCVCVLSWRGGECYCSVAVSVFIFNDWAFAIQNVTLYIEYELYIQLYIRETWVWVNCFENSYFCWIILIFFNSAMHCVSENRGRGFRPLFSLLQLVHRTSLWLLNRISEVRASSSPSSSAGLCHSAPSICIDNFMKTCLPCLKYLNIVLLHL